MLLFLWALGFAKVIWLSQILGPARFNSHILFVSVLNILFLKEQVMAGGEVPLLQAAVPLDIPVGSSLILVMPNMTRSLLGILIQPHFLGEVKAFVDVVLKMQALHL